MEGSGLLMNLRDGIQFIIAVMQNSYPGSNYLLGKIHQFALGVKLISLAIL